MNNTDRTDYHAACAELDRIKAFVDRPRCINCEEFSAGTCGHHGEIPEEYWYSPNDCKQWMIKLPF